MAKKSPDNELLSEIIEELANYGWDHELQPRIEQSDYVVDAVIWNRAVNDGQYLFFELADYGSGTREDLEKFWSEAQAKTGETILLAFPRPAEKIASVSLDWALLDKGLVTVATLPVAGLTDWLAELFQADTEEETEAGDAPQKAWFCQYRPGSYRTEWTAGVRPGSIVNWKTEQKSLPGEMSPGDAIVYWRAIDPENRNDRGGLVGTGRVVSTDLEADPDGINRFPTEVREFFEDNLIPRDEVISFAGIERTVWRGAVLELPADQAAKVSQLLQQRGYLSLFDQAPPAADESIGMDGQINVRRDDAEQDHDSLGRSALAVSLAWTLHETWCTEQGLEPFPEHAPQSDATGFLAHIDAPWGGGKTSFANLIARTLNPDLDGKVPEFLKKLYPDRTDMSGLFISKVHKLGALRRNNSAAYEWSAQTRKPWIIVSFNAWLNQHVDPPWWSFYQTILKACLASIWKEGVPLVKQRDDGEYYTEKSSVIGRLWQLGRLCCRELWWRFWTPRVRNACLTVVLVVVVSFILRSFDHFDLEALKNNFTYQTGSPLSAIISTAVMVILGGASVLWSIFATFTQSLLPGTPESARNYSLGSSDPLKRFRRHFARMIEVIERPVLVIIDDIDRCEPKFIVEMTRGLQTVLKSPRIVFLLLGDRKWIEQAFEIYHEDMKNIDVGPEHTFGGRFVEKAIQLSFVLPDIGDHKDDYVREVLTGHTENFTEERLQLRNRISKASTAEEIDEAGIEILDEQEDAGEDEVRPKQSTIREEVILRRAAQKQEVEQAIRHRLQPLARFLPGNPRHIKRIINAISMYQNSILLTEETYGDAEFGGTRWRQLVVGVVLMIGYPKSWSHLAKHPEWADDLIAGKKDPQIKPGEEESYSDLKENTNFVNLLSRAELLDDLGNTEQETKITTEVVRWLNRVIPVAAG